MMRSAGLRPPSALGPLGAKLSEVDKPTQDEIDRFRMSPMGQYLQGMLKHRFDKMVKSMLHTDGGSDFLRGRAREIDELLELLGMK